MTIKAIIIFVLVSAMFLIATHKVVEFGKGKVETAYAQINEIGEKLNLDKY